MPSTKLKPAPAMRNTPASSPIAKPAVAANKAMAVKLIASPTASATGPNLCSEAAVPSTIGKIGNTQGDNVESRPAKKARPKVAIVKMQPEN